MKFYPKTLGTYPAPVRLGIFTLILAIAWLPFALPLYRWGTDENTVAIATMAILYIEFLILAYFWGRKVHQYPSPFRHYGFVWTREMGAEWLKGILWGLGLVFLLFGGMVALNWAILDVSMPFFPILAEGFLSALGVGLAEELLFRGWFLSELEKDYSPTLALWSNTLFFAILHFIKPLSEIIRTFPQFVGLILLGLILVQGKRIHKNRLGFPIGLHSGLVWGYYLIAVGNLITYTQTVPPWVTGVDRNPLAGIMGLCVLGVVVGFLFHKTRSHPKPPLPRFAQLLRDLGHWD